ncbi:MAG TPA: isoprenylcysteine carboxylmethyltransferase family protein [Gemmatimonadaceae bacterium]|nr:isoprenylcysteine carboxylmethyltransferase family protein [Gemmatimonadaceae bacterium]
MTSPPTSPSVSPAEQARPARIGGTLFRYRSFLPVPLVAVALLAPGHLSLWGWVGGGALILLGEAIRLAGVAAAGTVTRRRSRNVKRLVTYGAFAWSRNPLYNGNFLIWLGFAIASGVWWFPIVAVLLFAVEYRYIVAYEEGVLESIFGETYLAYKARTPRWIPRPPREREAGEFHWAEAFKSETSTFLQYVALVAALVIKARLTNR